MRATEFDLGPLFRSTVGFDRVLEALRGAARAAEQAENYPPYDIERTGEDDYRVTLAVAGFRPDELSVTARRNLLVVAGERRAREDEGDGRHQVLHRGIAARAFERRFDLADHVEVVGARLADGLLTIELRRELPEAMRPRRIAIEAGPAPAGRSRPNGTAPHHRQPPQIEGHATYEATPERQAA